MSSRRPVAVSGARRRARGLTALLVTTVVAAVVLAGCASIPTSGAVREGSGVRSDSRDLIIRALARPPSPGMTDVQIVNGFLLASADFDGDHGVARQFLTTDAATSWNPAAQTVVYDESQAVDVVARTPGQVAFSAHKLAVITVQGDYQLAARSSMTTAGFTLKKVAGQWRIATLPSILFVTQGDVDRAYRTFDVYFPDPTRSVLVPNQVLLPYGPGTSTALVRSLLAGPTDWLKPAVRSAFPAGMKLVVDSAPIRPGGVVQVDLGGAQTQAGTADLNTMSAQLAWTLRQLPDVTGQQITIDGAPIAAAGAGTIQPIQSWATYDPDAFASGARTFFVRSGRLVELRAGGASKVAVVPGVLGDGRQPLRSPALSTSSADVAGLDRAGAHLLVGHVSATDKARTVLTGTSFTAPGWDRLDEVWTVDRSASGPVVWTVPLGKDPVRVTVRDLPAGRVLAFRVASDGVRVAAVVEDTTGDGSLYLGRIERVNGHIAVAGFRPVDTRVSGTSTITDVQDVTWAAADRFAVLGTSQNGTLEPSLVSLTGLAVQTLGPVDQAKLPIVSMATAPGRQVLVGTGDGNLWTFDGLGWALVGEGSDPTYAG